MKQTWKDKLNWKEFLRAALCMLPMLIAYGVGRGDIGVPLGQAGFLMSALPLPLLRFDRFTNGVIFLIFGLGLYLVGSVVAFDYWAAVFFTFFVSLALSFMTGWRMAAMLALTFFSVYTAGLNNSVPDAEKITNNYYAFTFAITWCTAISLFKFWPGKDLSAILKRPPLIARLKMGLRMGVGTTISIAIAEAFAFSRLGWAPSATANVVRFNETQSMARAKVRIIGTILGALGATIFIVIFPEPIIWIYGAFVLTTINGLVTNINKLGYFPFYTTIILILYSVADPSATTSNIVERILYNIVGVIVSYFVVLYSFPKIFGWIDRQEFAKRADELDRV